MLHVVLSVLLSQLPVAPKEADYPSLRRQRVVKREKTREGSGSKSRSVRRRRARGRAGCRRLFRRCR
jgi:hypothetical protein